MLCTGRRDQGSNTAYNPCTTEEWKKLLGRPPQLLVVEDNGGILSCVMEWFESDGWVVEGVEDGSAFFERIEPAISDVDFDLEYDCIVTDIMMPGIDVISILEGLRTTGCDVPIAVISAMPDPILPQRIFQLGNAEFFRKPFVISELYERMSTLLRCSLDGRTIH